MPAPASASACVTAARVRSFTDLSGKRPSAVDPTPTMYTLPLMALSPRGSASQHRHAGRTPAGSAIHEHDFVGCQPIIGKPPQKARDRNAQLEPRQRGAQAVVNAVTERYVPIGIAGNVEPIGIVELSRIAVGGADHDVENLAFADPAPLDLEILARGPDAA